MLQVKALHMMNTPVKNDLFSYYFIEHVEVLSLTSCDVTEQGCEMLAENMKNRIKPVKYFLFYGKIFINLRLSLNTGNYLRRRFYKF